MYATVNVVDFVVVGTESDIEIVLAIFGESLKLKTWVL